MSVRYKLFGVSGTTVVETGITALYRVLGAYYHDPINQPVAVADELEQQRREHGDDHHPDAARALSLSQPHRAAPRPPRSPLPSGTRFSTWSRLSKAPAHRLHLRGRARTRSWDGDELGSVPVPGFHAHEPRPERSHSARPVVLRFGEHLAATSPVGGARRSRCIAVKGGFILLIIISVVFIAGCRRDTSEVDAVCGQRLSMNTTKSPSLRPERDEAGTRRIGGVLQSNERPKSSLTDVTTRIQRSRTVSFAEEPTSGLS